ncbi:MAG: asparagine--tRNA ligase [Proteobacteria bacterium]|nr:asparagine--tRNA ligase [Pseudomonadota bacterium]
MKRIKIADIWKDQRISGPVLVKGWIRTLRNSKHFSFIELNDGSCLTNIQIIADNTLLNYTDVESLTTGSALAVSGTLRNSPGQGQSVEIHADTITIINKTPDSYPLQKKRHSDEFLRSIAHLRPRSNKYGAMFRIRSHVSMFIHNYFQNKGFFYIHTPVITGSDCEGAGEMFRVSNIKPGQMITQNGKPDFSSDFFGKETNLTVSGQLSAEMFALSLGDVYTFGPTFRAENSNTSRHAAEFWMVEPEMAFCDLTDTMTIAEEFIKYVVKSYLETCQEDFSLFSRFVDTELPHVMNTILSSDFERISYLEAVNILINSGKSFEFKVEFNSDLQSEHERFLSEEYFKKPVFIYNYPKNIKPFYMRMNDDDQTVAAMDLLVPNIGELIGGSQREERLDYLIKRMKDMGLKQEDYWWYIDSRKYGSVPHSGFGLGFERLLMLLTGVTNIRDVIPFPRTPGHIEF